MKKLLSLALVLLFTLSFTAFAASEFFCVTSSIAEGTTNAYIKETTISFQFNVDVGEVTVAVKKGGATFNDFTASVNAMDLSVIDVVFDNDFDYATKYEIDFSGSKSAEAVAVSGTFKKLTFTTEAAPIVEVKDISLVSGIGSGAITFPTEVYADDLLQGWTISLKNNGAEDKTVTVVLCLYDENGLMRKVVTSDKTIAAGADDTIGLGTVIPYASASGYTFSGGKAKLYIWNNVADKVPFVGAYEYSIN